MDVSLATTQNESPQLVRLTTYPLTHDSASLSAQATEPRSSTKSKVVLPV